VLGRPFKVVTHKDFYIFWGQLFFLFASSIDSLQFIYSSNDIHIHHPGFLYVLLSGYIALMYDIILIHSVGQVIPSKFAIPFAHKPIFGTIQILSMFVLTLIAFLGSGLATEIFTIILQMILLGIVQSSSLLSLSVVFGWMDVQRL
jgi:hypothetical protein